MTLFVYCYIMIILLLPSLVRAIAFECSSPFTSLDVTDLQRSVHMVGKGHTSIQVWKKCLVSVNHFSRVRV